MFEGLDTNAFYALGIPAYAVAMALEHRFAPVREGTAYRYAPTIGNFSTGLGEIVIGLILGPVYIWLYEVGYEKLALFHWPQGSVLAWIAVFFVADFGYYWTHRLGHGVAFVFAMHGVHHQPEEFNLGVATRHPWFSDIFSIPFYTICPLLGFDSVHFFVAISFISFYAFSVHSLALKRPSLYIFVTPQTHLVHHCYNGRYVGKNLGALFTLWDRLFGTHEEIIAEDPPKLGTRAGYRTHDGVFAQWIHFRDLLTLARQTPLLRHKLAVFIRHPGWQPPGAALPPQQPARQDRDIPLAVRRYTGIALLLTLLFSIYVLWFRAGLPFWLQCISIGTILASLSTIGGLMDGRKHARRYELIRLAACTAFGLALLAQFPILGGTIAAGCGVSLLLLNVFVVELSAK